MTQYYRNAGGNSNGVPVQVISVNTDCSDLTLENSYIQTYGLELVADDCNWVAYDQFNYGGIPQFAVINGTTNSVNYTQWQILSEPTGYLTNDTVPLLLKSYIDAIQTPAPIITVTNPVNGAVIGASNIPLGAKITTNGKNIKQVSFFNGTTLLGSITNTPCSQTWSNGGFWAVGGRQATNMFCSLTWSNVPVGAKSVFARAYYGTSSSADSAAVNFTVVTPVSTVLTVNTNGNGTVNPNYNGVLLQIGNTYSMTASNGPGFAFVNWTGSITTNVATLTFTMASNLTFTANFVDVQNPTNTITLPTPGQLWSNALFMVTGMANDNVAVSNVLYSLNNAAWTNALTANNWTNWTATVTLVPGTNTIAAYAVDTSGNVSVTNSVSFIYVVNAVLMVSTNGVGSLSTNYNLASLQIGNSYSITATAGTGFVFTNWTGGTNLPLNILTNGPTLQFVMEPNLMLQANFVPLPIPTGSLQVTIPPRTLCLPEPNGRWMAGHGRTAGRRYQGCLWAAIQSPSLPSAARTTPANRTVSIKANQPLRQQELMRRGSSPSL